MNENTYIDQNKAEGKLQFDKTSKEFSKIHWPKKKTVWGNTATVIIVAAILSVLIFFVDLGLRSGIESLVK